MTSLTDIEKWVRDLSKIESKLAVKASKGDLQALNLYSTRVGKSLSRLIIPIVTSPNFISSSNDNKATVIREVLASAALQGNEVVSALAFESMTEFLKSNGYVFNAAESSKPDERLKGIIAGSLAFYINKENPVAGANVLKSGFPQIIDIGSRSTIINSSELVRNRTGEYLTGKRLIPSSKACDFCKSFAGKVYPITSKMEASHFHDYCDCQLVILSN